LSDSAPDVTRTMASGVPSGGLETHPPLDPPPPSSPEDVAAVRAYVQSSPLFPQLGLHPASTTDAAAETWAHLAETLCAFLRLDPNDLAPAAAARVYKYYVPAYLWCVGRLEKHRHEKRANERPNAKTRPLCVALTAPQGCGKTTLVAALEFLFEKNGVAAASASIDDFYLTGAEQDKLSLANPGNALLKYRGNAGTHDVQLAVNTLRSLRSINDDDFATKTSAERNADALPTTETKKKTAENHVATLTVSVPRYDKTLRGGRGDRAARELWPEITAPLDIVLLEGWMLGFAPVADDSLAFAAHPDLPAVNAALRDDAYGDLHALLDDWIVVRVRDTRWVRSWRLEAEQQARSEGRPTLTDAEVGDFVNRFLPAYDLYAGAMYRRGPWRGGTDLTRDSVPCDEGSVFVVEVDATRNVVGGREESRLGESPRRVV
jgi:D-glycerate 3-kinase